MSDEEVTLQAMHAMNRSIALKSLARCAEAQQLPDLAAHLNALGQAEGDAVFPLLRALALRQAIANQPQAARLVAVPKA